MMKAVLFLAGMSLAAASDQAQCAVDGAAAINQMSDAAIYLWAAYERCKSTNGGNPLSPACAVDISFAIQAVDDLTLVIVKAAKECGAIDASNYGCGMAVGKFTSATAGLSAAAAGIVKDCPGGYPTSTDPKVGELTNVGKCVIDGKGTVSSLFHASANFAHVIKDCKDGEMKCARNALNIVAGLSNMGSAVAGLVNDCSAIKNSGNENAACSQSSLLTVGSANEVALAAMDIAKACKVDDSRLYELNFPAEEKAPASGFMLAMLAAFVPVAAFIGFVMGGRFIKGRTVCNTDMSTREVESLVAFEEQ